MDSNDATVVRTADDNPISETIVFAVAAARAVCPTELETPLHSAIDADAVDRLVSGADPTPNLGTVRIEFTWAGCDVAVDETGRVVVTPIATEASRRQLPST